MRCPAQGATDGWVMLGLVFKWSPFCEFSLLLLFLTYCVWGLHFPGFRVEFFLPFGFCPSKAGLVVCVNFLKGEICAEFLFVCLLVFPLMGKAEWGGNPACWWLGLYFYFVCCLDKASCTGYNWWLGDTGSCIPVVSFVWILTIWYHIGLVLW